MKEQREGNVLRRERPFDKESKGKGNVVKKNVALLSRSLAWESIGGGA